MRKKICYIMMSAFFLITLVACKQDSIQRTEEIAPPVTSDTAVGVGWYLNYVDDSFIIFQGEFGLFGYDLNEKRITFAMDLMACVGAAGFQGSEGSCAVRVTPNGRLAQVYADKTSDVYYINTHEGTYYVAPYEPMEERFDPLTLEDGHLGDMGTTNTKGTGTLSELCFCREENTWMVFEGYF